MLAVGCRDIGRLVTPIQVRQGLGEPEGREGVASSPEVGGSVAVPIQAVVLPRIDAAKEADELVSIGGLAGQA